MRGLDSSSSSKSKGRQRDPNSKITIRVDKLLKKTYSGLVSGKIKNLIQQDVTPSNKLLTAYIHQIYEQYNIEDAFQKYGSKRHSNFIPQSHLSYEDQLNSSPSVSGYDSTSIKRKSQLLKRSKQKIVKLKSKGIQQYPIKNSIISKLNKNRDLESSRQSRQSSSSIRKKITFTTPQTNKIKVLDSMNTQGSNRWKDLNTIKTQAFQQQQQSILITTRFSEQTQIKSLYRYCIGCECSILEANIKFHEIKCKQLQMIYELSFDEILTILNKKISNIKKQINKIVSNQNHMCGQIKPQIKKWLSQFEQNHGNLSYDLESYYQKIKKSFYCESVSLIELANRLRWFVKIQHQLKTKFLL